MIAASLIWVWALTAAAPPAVEEARALFEIGADAYERANYDLAIDAFEQAYLKAPRPAVAFSLAQAYRMNYSVQNNPEYLQRAAELYTKYVGEVKSGGRREDAARHLFNVKLLLIREHGIQGPSSFRPLQPKLKTQLAISTRTKEAKGSIDGGPLTELPFSREVAPGSHKIRVEAPGHYPEEVEPLAVEGSLVAVVVTLRAMPAMLDIRATHGAEVSIDGRPVGEAPLDQKLAVEAGDHFLAITKRGAHAYVRELTVARGEAVELEVELEVTDQRRLAQAAFIGTGVLAAAGLVTTTFTFIADGRAAELGETHRERGYLDEGEAKRLNQRLRERDRFGTASVALLGGATVLGATGAMLYLFDSPRIPVEPRARPSGEPSVVPIVGPDTVGAAVGGTF